MTHRLGVGPSVYSLAPVWDDVQPYYGMFVEESDALAGEAAPSFLRDLELALREHNSEYESKRDSRRLGPLRLLIVPHGFWSTWDHERLQRSGGVPEQYKHPCLLGDVKFRTGVTVLREVQANRDR